MFVPSDFLDAGFGVAAGRAATFAAAAFFTAGLAAIAIFSLEDGAGFAAVFFLSAAGLPADVLLAFAD
ncbi:MAG: hypothetical protein WC026_00745 [Hyphomicrobium sp.]|uniref:hypothetical protein n=1 Tax=Hyphomicrobium sp. TaxID=82 RepID=UPI003561D369